VVQYDFESSIGYWLTVSTQGLHRALNDELAPTGITYRQSQVIGWLKLEREMTVGELAGRMMIEPPTLVGILDRMEGMGWIGRHSSTLDRRRKLIRLTEAAEPVWERIVQCFLQVRGLAMAGMSPEQVETLLGLLRTIHENLRAYDARRESAERTECESV
jgi:MarR family transcriptional regulator for hemolysin